MPAPLARQGLQRIKAHMLADTDPDLPPISIALNSNESALGPSPYAVQAAKAAVSGIERYLEAPEAILAPALGERFGLDPRRIAIGQGSDDLLARIARAYLHPGTELLRSVNGYLKTPNYAHANDAVPVAAADRDFCPCVDGLLAALGDRTRIVYLANPENPAGSYLSGVEIRRLHAGLPDHVLLVLDCAYEEYVDAPDYEPGHRLVEEADNVVMVRTFSKIFGLAGARIGWLYGSPSLVDMVNRIGLTFPVSSPGLAAAVAALRDRTHTQTVRNDTIRKRAHMTRSLAGLGLKVYPSQTNFLLVGFPDPALTAVAAAATLRRRGIAVRRFASPAYEACLRITLGSNTELGAAANALADFLEGGGDV